MDLGGLMAQASFSDLIKSRRRELGLSQRELARASGVQQAKISQIENGLRPTSEQAWALGKALRLLPEEVAARSGYSEAEIVDASKHSCWHEDPFDEIEHGLARGHWPKDVRRGLLALARFTQPTISLHAWAQAMVEAARDAYGPEELRQLMVAMPTDTRPVVRAIQKASDRLAEEYRFDLILGVAFEALEGLETSHENVQRVVDLVLPFAGRHPEDWHPRARSAVAEARDNLAASGGVPAGTSAVDILLDRLDNRLQRSDRDASDT
jgi:transcriptional regulator with XRE-family HTH domain